MKKSLIACSLLALGAAMPAYADISVNVGAIGVMPNDSSGSLPVIETVAGAPVGSMGVSVNSDVQLGLTIDYKINDNWTVELIAATPFSHDIKGTGAIAGLNVGKTKHLPPTLMAQYHFDVGHDAFKPFVGLGLNYTTFFEDKVDPELAGTLTSLGVTTANDSLDLALSDSFGYALQAGFNYKLSEQWGVHFMVSRMDIDTTADVRINGVTAESVDVKIDPTVAMLGLRYMF